MPAVFRGLPTEVCIFLWLLLLKKCAGGGEGERAGYGVRGAEP